MEPDSPREDRQEIEIPRGVEITLATLFVGIFICGIGSLIFMLASTAVRLLT